MNLKLFTQSETLQRIGARRLAILLRPFAPELQALNFPMPPPDEPQDDAYFHTLAAAISRTDALPSSLFRALLTLERAAAPESNPRLEDAIRRRLPNVSLPPDFILDRALEVWIVAPEELTEFAPPEACRACPSPGATTPNATNLAISGGLERVDAAAPDDRRTPPASSIQLPASSIPSEAASILDALQATLTRFAVLPKCVPETVALFVFHTFAWELREITTYLGIESPQHRCGKSTLLAIIRRLCSRPEGAAHISGPAVFRTIDKGKPTLLVDETEKVMKRNQLLQGILNASYSRELAYVIRVIPQSKKKTNGDHPQPLYIPLDAYESSSPASASSSSPSNAPNSPDDVARFSCWCPKVMAQIGHFPETLADRCIIITMQRKTAAEKCERVRNLKQADAAELRRRCAEFVRQHRDIIAHAEPAIPAGLNDRAADIWEPLLVLADLAGGDWPQKARQAALALSGAEQTNNLISSLLLDCVLLFIENKTERLFTRDLVQKLNAMPPRPWRELTKGKPVDEYWLGRQLRPFGIRPQTLWSGKQSAKGYLHEDFLEPARRYVAKPDWEAYLDTVQEVQDPPQQEPPQQPGPNQIEVPQPAPLS